MLINIIKSTKSIGIQHLDVDFELIDRRGRERYRGLIGDVQKKRVEKMMNIQGNERAILKINYRMIHGKKKRNSKTIECIHASIKDILYRKSVREYVKIIIK